MRREGRVRGKPTSKSRLTGRCRMGKTRCRRCREHPVEKSREERMGKHKRFAADVGNNPALAELSLDVQLIAGGGRLTHVDMDRDIEDEPSWRFSAAGEDASVTENLANATVNSVIDAGFGIIYGPGEFEMEDELDAAMANCSSLEFAPIPEDEYESALQMAQWGMFENEVLLSFVRNRPECRLSEESWSDVDLLEPSEQGSSVEDDDDWSLVDGDHEEEDDHV